MQTVFANIKFQFHLILLLSFFANVICTKVDRRRKDDYWKRFSNEMEKVGVVGWFLKVIKVWWISKRGSLIKCLLSWAVVSVFFRKKSKIMIKFIQRLKNMILWLYLIASICQVFINFFLFSKRIRKEYCLIFRQLKNMYVKRKWYWNFAEKLEHSELFLRLTSFSSNKLVFEWN